MAREFFWGLGSGTLTLGIGVLLGWQLAVCHQAQTQQRSLASRPAAERVVYRIQPAFVIRREQAPKPNAYFY